MCDSFQGKKKKFPMNLQQCNLEQTVGSIYTQIYKYPGSKLKWINFVKKMKWIKKYMFYFAHPFPIYGKIILQ